jgi:hypothetical protein
MNTLEEEKRGEEIRSKGRGNYLGFDPPNTIVEEPDWVPREGALRDRSPKKTACGGPEEQRRSHPSEKGIGSSLFFLQRRRIL